MSEALKLKILGMVKEDLEKIEIALSENLSPYLDLVSDIARHILFSGGKRLRPLLTVTSAKLCGYNGNNTSKLSTIFEYLHAATLLHDDLVDGGTLRRGKKAAHLKWDNSSAVLVGDFLLARSLSIAAETGRTDVIKVVAKITENMSQGEIHQMLHKGAIDLTEEEYLQVISNKTAVLFQGACRFAAIIADATDAHERALSDYGYNLGIAFQMADDLLDYTEDSTALGKIVGADLREGKLTLPVIHALANARDGDRERIFRFIHNPVFATTEFQELIALLEKWGGIQYTRTRAAEHIHTARKALAVFDDCPAKEILLDIAQYAMERNM